MLSGRKYFLDWLRIGAFGFLIFFHTGLLYVDWGYNIMSERLVPKLEYLLICVSPWRLALLFFISGVASRFLIEKLRPGNFSLERVKRLFVVLALGTWVIVPIQIYVELLHKRLVETGYLDFWLSSYLPGKSPPGYLFPSWGHLWFLIYLLIYALGFALLFSLFRHRKLRQVPLIVLVLLPGVWLAATNLLIEEFSPVTMDLVNDWGNHLRWIGIFAAGIACAGRDDFWTFARNSRRRLLMVSLVALGLHLGNGVYWRSGAADPFWDWIIYSVIRGFYGWAMILTLVGYAGRYLNRQTRLLRYLSDAVLPIYVVHQPLLILSAYFLFPASLPFPIEITLLCLMTGTGSLTFYELFVRRWSIARFLFGLKVRAPIKHALHPLPG